LQEAHKFGVKKGYINGIAVGFVFLSLFWVEAFALWYGAQLVFAGEMSAGDMLIVRLCLTLLSIHNAVYTVFVVFIGLLQM
jgi:hypothetical protein